MKQKSAIVIGAGFSGLSAASFLAAGGFNVTVLEKNEMAGGRARHFCADGFMFDMGPSWYWMPDVFEKFFAQFGKQVGDYYSLIRLSPSYRVYFDKSDYIDVPSSVEELSALFESLERGAAKQLDLFLKEAAYKYKTGMEDLVYKPGKSIREFLHPGFIKGLWKLDVFSSHAAHVRKFFRHPRIIKMLEFPVLFLGARPERTPALYSLMNYADLKLGTWYPKGGMYKIAEAMESLAKSLGVTFHYQSAVTGIQQKNNLVTGVITENKSYSCDYLTGTADYRYIDQLLLDKSTRSYSPSYWDSRMLAPSCLIFFLGVNKRLKNLQHHNLFFDKDFGKHAREIYDKPQWPSEPLFYVCCPSVTDDTVAPPGYENLFVLIPVASGIEDRPEIRENYYQLILERLENLTGNTIKDHVIFKKSYAIRDFENDYHAFKGNAYGLANTLGQTAIFKPSLHSKKLKNLVMAGQLTVPGPGVPPALISGEIAAKSIITVNQKTHE